MPNGTGNFRNFQISRKKDNLERGTEIFETIFRKLSVPFDFEPRFPEILVEWNALLVPDDTNRTLALLYLLDLNDRSSSESSAAVNRPTARKRFKQAPAYTSARIFQFK